MVVLLSKINSGEIVHLFEDSISVGSILLMMNGWREVFL